MTDTEETRGVDRRRFIKGAAGGAALIWAAPTVAGLDARAFAAGSDPDCHRSFHDDFDEEGAGRDFSPGYATTTTLVHFTVTGGNIDIIGDGPSGGGNDFFSGNGYYLDLSGTNSNGGSESGVSILTTKQTLCEGSYHVTIKYAGDQRGNGNNSMVATLGDGTSGVLAPPPDSLILTSMFDANVPAGGGNLVISHNSGGADNQGVILLEVTITAI